MTNITKDDIAERLELMVDRNGLFHVLTGLAIICEEKAEHLRSNWQDEITAKTWQRDANQIERILGKISN